jgi:phage terminase large subunit-like protein
MRDCLKLKKQQRKRSKLSSQTTDNPALATDIGEWIAVVRPKYLNPKHLGPLLVPINEAAAGFERFVTGSVPPRHGKTETLIAALVHRLKFKPGSRVGYFSYSDKFAANRSREARRLAAAIGLRSVEKRAPGVDDDIADTVHYWETNNGGSFLAAGRRGQAIGVGLDLIVVDDPFNGEREARSEAVREEVWAWFTGTVMQRLEPGGSIIIIHTRWNDDDLIGRLQDPNEPAGEDFVHVNLTAVAENDNDPLGRAIGAALWPERYDEKALAKKRKLGEHAWWAQYMGKPRPIGERLFHDPARYEPLDPRVGLNGWKIGIGIDPAATAKTSSDNSAVVVIAYKTEKRDGEDQLVVRVLRVYTFKLEIPDVVAFLEVLQRKWLGAPFAIEVTGPGLGVFQTLKRIAPTLNMIAITSTQDKFMRAQPTAAVWNDSRVEVPLQENVGYDSPEIVKALTDLGVYRAEWVAEYIKRMGRFTGNDGGKDDETDATVHIVNFAIDTSTAENDNDEPFKPRKARALGGF